MINRSKLLATLFLLSAFSATLYAQSAADVNVNGSLKPDKIKKGRVVSAVVVMDIPSGLHIHHMNPVLPSDLRNENPDILNPEYLISTTQATHNAIHYGDEKQLPRPFVGRSPGDTWF